MGIAYFKQAFRKVFESNNNVRFVMLGLDGAGKTSILYKMKLNEIVATIPTIGFNVETVCYKNLQMTIWDIGGQDKIRKLWNYYYNGTSALIFVVDSSDLNRIDESRDEMWSILNNDEMKGKPVLVFANKQDHIDAMNSFQITDKMGLINCKSHPWFVQPCSATNGEGLYEGLEWVSNESVKYQRNKEKL
jgi:small GTP-binding protein